MTRSLVECIIHSSKLFPQKGIISKRIVSNTILLGKPSNGFNMKFFFFESYAMVYTGTTNTLKIQKIPSITLRESNGDGGHFFICCTPGNIFISMISLNYQ